MIFERVLAFATVFALFASPGVASEPSGHAHGAAPAPPPRAQAKGAEEPRVAVDVAPAEQEKIGLALGTVERKSLRRAIRTVGTVAQDETREAHVHTRFSGWIEDIRVNYVGRAVKKGETLCFFYSPEIVAIQDEYSAARGRAGVAADVARSALDRLARLGVPRSEIARLERGEASRVRVPIESPIDGFVVEKNAVQGIFVTPDMHLYRIADLSRIWILATLYEYDLTTVAVGDEADVTFTYDPSRHLRGRITYLYPDVDPRTRTGRARLEIANADVSLKPGMFVNVSIDKDLGEVLVVPVSAVIDTGTRRIVFVRGAENRFEPREVALGAKEGEVVAVLSGLAAGERVVTRANFLIDAQSRLEAALDKGVGGGHAGHGSQK